MTKRQKPVQNAKSNKRSLTQLCDTYVNSMYSFIDFTVHNLTMAWCLKVTEKVSFNIASEASYVCMLGGQKFMVNLMNF